MGGYWKKLAWIWVWRHVRLGLAPLPLGVAPRRLGIDGDHADKPMLPAGRGHRLDNSPSGFRLGEDDPIATSALAARETKGQMWINRH